MLKLCHLHPVTLQELSRGPVVRSGLHHYSTRAGSHDLRASVVRPNGPLNTLNRAVQGYSLTNTLIT